MIPTQPTIVMTTWDLACLSSELIYLVLKLYYVVLFFRFFLDISLAI